jgi:hypothetical protein
MANVGSNASQTINSWLGLGPLDAQHDDIVNDCVAWFGRTATALMQAAVLKSVKIAPIGADGLYLGSPIEREVSQNGAIVAQSLDDILPNVTAVKCTLHTAGDLGRVKGGFYAPLPGLNLQSDARWSDTDVNAMRGSLSTLIANLNNAPGIDYQDLVVVVASQGRHNKNGSVKFGPANYPVTGVSVGRVPDVVRRRRNRQSEGPRTVSTV